MGFFDTGTNSQGQSTASPATQVAGGAGTLGGAFQALSSPFLQKWSQDFARHEAGQAWERNVKAWEMQNEYNLPVNEVQRLKDAGLNPHMMYGGAPARAGGVGSAPKASQPDFNYKTGEGMQTISQSLMLAQSMRRQEVEIQGEKLNNELRDQEKLLKFLAARKLAWEVGFEPTKQKYQTQNWRLGNQRIAADIGRIIANQLQSMAATELTKEKKRYQKNVSDLSDKGVYVGEDWQKGLFRRLMENFKEYKPNYSMPSVPEFGMYPPNYKYD